MLSAEPQPKELTMKFANVGTVDRLLRLIIGAALIAVLFVMSQIEFQSAPGIAAIAVGAILIITATIKFCPIYGLLGWRTRP